MKKTEFLSYFEGIQLPVIKMNTSEKMYVLENNRNGLKTFQRKETFFNIYDNEKFVFNTTTSIVQKINEANSEYWERVRKVKFKYERWISEPKT